MQHRWKCIHVECNAEEAKFVQASVAKAKDMDIFTLVWGKQVWLTNAAETSSDPKNIA